MKHHRVSKVFGYLFILSVIPCLCSFCGLIGYLTFEGFPPTEILARLYLMKVIAGDANGASDLAFLQRPDDICLRIAKQDALRDIAQFGGAEVKDLSISIYHGTGSDDYFETAMMTFKYRKSNQEQWSDGKILLESDANYWGLRYLCGNLEYHGP